MNRIRIALYLSVVAVVGAIQTSMAGIPQSIEIKITGEYLSIPSAKPDTYQGWGNVVAVDVDGVKVHQFTLGMPSRVEDVAVWGSLDMSDYVGKTATIRNVVGHQENMAGLPLIQSSDRIQTLVPLYTEQGRPQFHFSQKVGWNNDPNGMVYVDGLYHLSWQSNPVGLGWGNMYWGHAVSKDLVHWEELPHTIRIGANDLKGNPERNVHPAMVRGQAFSGGACLDHNNTLGLQKGDIPTVVAMVTDTKGGDPENDDGGHGTLVGESLAYSTDGGFTYTIMKEANPLISHHGRDPKPFWYAPAQHWCIVTYRQTEQNLTGKMAFYSSNDLKNWDFNSFSDRVFHECPEFVELPVDGDVTNKKWILFDATPKYQIGTFEGKTFSPDFEGTRRGIGGNLKAAQCFSNAPDDRAIMMAWARFKPADRKAPFNQGFTLPLELSLRTTIDGIRCYANPVKELEVLRKGDLLTVKNKALEVGENTLSFDKTAKLVEVAMTLAYPSGRKPSAIHLQLGHTKILCDLKNNTFHGADGKYDALTSYDKEDGKLDLRIFIDSATVETFAENGAVYFIHNRTDQDAALNDMKIHVEGGEATIQQLTAYELKSIHSKP
jgi:fructan beta-fructosidase